MYTNNFNTFSTFVIGKYYFNQVSRVFSDKRQDLGDLNCQNLKSVLKRL